MAGFLTSPGGAIEAFPLCICRSSIFGTLRLQVSTSIHYSQATKSSLHLNSFIGYVSCSRLLWFTPLRTIHRPIRKQINRTGPCQPCCDAVCMVFIKSGMQTVLQSRTPTESWEAILQTLVYLDLCSIGASRTLSPNP